MVEATQNRNLLHGNFSKLISQGNYHSKPTMQSKHSATKQMEELRNCNGSPLKGIKPECLDARGTFTGQGTFGKYFLAKYRGMLVITKEDASLALAREQVRILESLPGHRSLP